MLIPDGEYDFEVESAEDKTSKGGNEMIALTLKVWDHNGAAREIRDWLVNSDAAMCQLKIRKFCEATDLMEAYQDGSLNAMMCQGVAGRVAIGATENAQYGPQNVVEGYLHDSDQEPQAPLGVPAEQTRRANAALADEDIPF